jgi:undecaprenyl-diphosphatase
MTSTAKDLTPPDEPGPASASKSEGRVRLTHWRASRVRWWIVGGGFVAAVLSGMLYAIAVKSTGDWHQGLAWERAMMARVDYTLPPWLDILFLTIPWTATNITLAPFTYGAALWLGKRGRWDLALHVSVVQTGSFALNFAMKFLFDRARPDLWEKRGQFSWASYPSGHAIASVAVLFTVAYLLDREKCWKWPYAALGVMAVITLWSRLYLGVHWPTDVIGGGIMGIVWLGATLAGFARRSNCDD